MNHDEQYRLVYEGIKAVAEHCDGAQTQDKVGFNGQDTKFGKRIASVPFEDWTPDVREEAARIAVTYRKQIEGYTGIDVTTLDVVKAAQDAPTNYTARDQARTYERRQRDAHKADERKVDYVQGNLLFTWVKGDPDFTTLLAGVKALPGRDFNWSTKTNVVPISAKAIDFILEWDFPLTPAATVALQVFQSTPQEPTYDFVPEGAEVKVSPDTTADYAVRNAVFALPGRHWAGSYNLVAASQALLDLAAQFNLNVHPQVVEMITVAKAAAKRAEADQAAAGDRQALLRQVSRIGKPEELPASFVALVRKAVVR